LDFKDFVKVGNIGITLYCV